MKHHHALTWLIAALGILAIAIGCSQRRSEPTRGPLVLETQDLRNGERAFMATCHQCHPHGERGLGPALNDKPLPSFMIKNQVRAGGGAMPAFNQDHISDQELDNLVAYMARLRGHAE